MSLILDALRIKKEGIHLEASGLVVHSERWHKSLVSRKGLMLGFSLMLFGGAVVLGLKYYRDHKESLSIVSQSAALAPAPIVAIGVPAKPTLTSQVSHNYKLGNYRENRQLLAEALATAKQRLLIIAPWVKQAVVNTDFVAKLEQRLRAGVEVTVAHGYGDDDRGSDEFALNRLSNLAARYEKFTFVRVKNEQELEHGDYVFIGRKLLRVEITAA